MKLFGDSGKHLHTQKKKTEPAPPPTPEAEPKPRAEQAETQAIREKPAAVQAPQDHPAAGGFFRSAAWRRLRIPAIIVGVLIVLALLVVLVYSIWEKPPEIRQTDGPNVKAPFETVKPAVETPAPPQETAQPAVIPVETTLPEESPEPTAEPTEAPVTSGRRDSCYTFVILAYDQAFANTDTILVGRLDTEAGTLDAVNIPRDTLVNVSWGVKKVNTILALERNDTDRFLEHLGNLLGFTPDCYAVVNMRAVEKLVDCIGGVYYNVPRDMDYDDPTQELYIHIPGGYQLLNGENAVKVLRFREGNNNSGYYNGDLGRIATQQDFLMTMASQFLKLGNIPNLNNAIQIFEDNVNTDLTANNIAFFVREFLKLDKENIRFHTMPGRLVSIRGGSYLEVVIDEWVEILNSSLNPFYQEITADNLDILQSQGIYGAVSTTGEVLPITSFLDFNQYLTNLQGNSDSESTDGTE